MLGERPDLEEGRASVAVAWFVATCISVFCVHLLGWQPSVSLATVAGSASFAGTLMGILLAHELGHWLFARWRGFRLSLPWFLPAPILVGTLGAIIRVEERPRTRDDLVGLGLSGPLAGLAAILLVLILRAGLGSAGLPSDWALSRPLLWWVVGAPLDHTVAPTPTDPLGFAAWIGCLVTAMNLLPFGQLDGGHVLAGVAPWLPRRSAWLVTVLLLGLGLFWPPWAVWAAVLHLIGARHPLQVRDERPPLGALGRGGAALAVVVFLLCFTPLPTSW